MSDKKRKVKFKQLQKLVVRLVKLLDDIESFAHCWNQLQLLTFWVLLVEGNCLSFVFQFGCGSDLDAQQNCNEPWFCQETFSIRYNFTAEQSIRTIILIN